jgi:hypothetical protein
VPDFRNWNQACSNSRALSRLCVWLRQHGRTRCAPSSRSGLVCYTSGWRLWVLRQCGVGQGHYDDKDAHQPAHYLQAAIAAWIQIRILGLLRQAGASILIFHLTILRYRYKNVVFKVA